MRIRFWESVLMMAIDRYEQKETALQDRHAQEGVLSPLRWLNGSHFFAAAVALLLVSTRRSQKFAQVL